MPSPPARLAAPAPAFALACAIALAAGAALLGAAPAAGTAGTKPSVVITGTSVKDGVVTVKVRIAGWKLYAARMGKAPNAADGGHWHVLVDGKTGTMAAAPSARTRALAAGTHRIVAELVHNDHSSLSSAVRSAAVTVTVSAGGGKVTIPEAGTTTAPAAPAPASGDGGGAYGY